MRTFEDIVKLYDTDAVISEQIAGYWINAYAQYMKCEVAYSRGKVVFSNADNQYRLVKLQVERDYAKREVELVETKLFKLEN
jgi:hypothetical protein